MNRIEVSDAFELLGGPRCSNEEMQRLAAIGLMTSGIVHDFGNLVQVITSAVHLIELNLNQDAPVDLRALVREASDSVGRATALSRQIVGFSRAGNADSAMVYLGSVLSAIRNPIRWIAGPAIRVELSLDDNLPAVFCNVRELENVALNLVVNAKDAMPDGGHLSIAAYGADFEGGTTVVLRVTDTGCGMSSETARRAVQPFFTTKQAGNGLGLALVNEFVRRVGGSLQIESAQGQGTSVILRFPGYRN